MKSLAFCYRYFDHHLPVINADNNRRHEDERQQVKDRLSVGARSAK